MGFFNWGKLDQRRHPRVQTPGLTTVFGDVLDLSASGLCVFRKGDAGCQIGQDVAMDIRLEEHRLQTTARVVRINPLGFCRYEIGLAFVALGEDDLQAIATLQSANPTEALCPRAWLAA